MNKVIHMDIPIDEDAASALQTPQRRAALGRYLSGLLRDGRIAEVLSAAIAEAKREARENGLSDGEIDAEVEVWRGERSS